MHIIINKIRKHIDIKMIFLKQILKKKKDWNSMFSLRFLKYVHIYNSYRARNRLWLCMNNLDVSKLYKQTDDKKSFLLTKAAKTEEIWNKLKEFLPVQCGVCTTLVTLT